MVDDMTEYSIEQRALDEQKAKDLAIAAMAVSIMLLLSTFGLLAFIGAIMGHTAMRRLEQVGNRTHRGFATAAILVGWIGTGLACIGLLIAFVFFITWAVSSSI